MKRKGEIQMKFYEHRVQYYETDKMGIVHHSNYIRWMEEARIDFLDQIGWNYKVMEDNGIISPVTSVESKYKCNTVFGDVISIEVGVEEFKGIRLKLRYVMRKGDVVVNEATSEHCFLDMEGKVLNMKKIKPEFYETLARLVYE